MTAYLEKRLAAALRMAACADSVCARNSHLHLARLYRLRLMTMQAVHQGKRPPRLWVPATKAKTPGEPGDVLNGPRDLPRHRA
ncbi:hypothetical protein BH10PSE12_BH10PSE12_17370 [soil metagenome]